MSEEYLAEMRALEKEEVEQRRLHSLEQVRLRDQHNTLDPMLNYQDYKHVVNTSLDLSPRSSDTWLDYYTEAKIKAAISAKKNRNSHIFGPHGHWHTHIMPDCFMCEDNITISTLVRVIGLMAHHYPKNVF